MKSSFILTCTCVHYLYYKSEPVQYTCTGTGDGGGSTTNATSDHPPVSSLPSGKYMLLYSLIINGSNDVAGKVQKLKRTSMCGESPDNP